jgi:hypothetical protein
MNIFKNMEYIKNLLRIIRRKNNLRGEQTMIIYFNH